MQARTRHLRPANSPSRLAKPRIEPLEARALLSFVPAVAHSTGATPTSVAMADFNLDQHLDFAVTNGGDGNVSVALGVGDGTFQSSLDHFVNGSSFLTSVATGDFNGDDVPDLAVGRFQSNNDAGWISVLLGEGDGTFAGPVSYAAGLRTWDVAAGDINGDGKLDLVASNVLGGNVSVLIGVGDGKFSAAVNLGTGGTSPSGLALGDFNQDGKLDIAVANYGSDKVGLLLNTGNGTFAAPRLFLSGGTGPNALAAGDFNGDGRLDLAVANRGGSNNVSVLRCTRPGAFRFFGNLDTGVATEDVTVTDVDRDGALDIATANEFSETVTLWRGNGNATFHGREDYAVGRLTFSIAAGDVNGDDFPDIVTADLYGIGASILINAANWAPTPIVGGRSHESLRRATHAPHSEPSDFRHPLSAEQLLPFSQTVQSKRTIPAAVRQVHLNMPEQAPDLLPLREWSSV